MKVSLFLAAAVAQVASAHYFMDAVLVSGSYQTRYVRASTRPTKYNPTKFSSNPAADLRDGATIDGPDGRCNQGAFSNAGKTDVLSVTAGSEVRLRLAVGATMQHPGPALVYMSRAPGDNVKGYDGSGDWFKIFQEGVKQAGQGDFTTNAWSTWDRNYIAATIPRNVPNGEYLVRFEHIGVHRSHVKQPEHYISCLQVKVTGGGNGAPGPTVKFPGAYRDNDPYATFSIYGGHKTFPFPGPAVWNGSGTSNPVTTTRGNTTPTTTAAGNNGGGSGSPLYGQCGGSGWTGPKTCSQGRCVASNEWYSQCVP